MSCTSCAGPRCGSRCPLLMRRPVPPWAPSLLPAVPGWHCRSLTALLSYQRAEVVDRVDQELPDHRLVGRIHVAECVPQFGPGQRYRFLDLPPPGVGQMEPDHTGVCWLQGGMHTPCDAVGC